MQGETSFSLSYSCAAVFQLCVCDLEGNRRVSRNCGIYVCSSKRKKEKPPYSHRLPPMGGSQSRDDGGRQGGLIFISGTSLGCVHTLEVCRYSDGLSKLVLMCQIVTIDPSFVYLLY